MLIYCSAHPQSMRAAQWQVHNISISQVWRAFCGRGQVAVPIPPSLLSSRYQVSWCSPRSRSRSRRPRHATPRPRSLRQCTTKRARSLLRSCSWLRSLPRPPPPDAVQRAVVAAVRKFITRVPASASDRVRPRPPRSSYQRSRVMLLLPAPPARRRMLPERTERRARWSRVERAHSL
jgi:hypothetical protein